ncbi:MAG TPA: AraC family transcriptional regulator [Phytomonospora sp.]
MDERGTGDGAGIRFNGSSATTTAGERVAQMSEPPGWRGRVALPPGRLYFQGEIGPAAPHAHRVVLVFGAADPFVLSGHDGVARSCRAAVVPSGARHAIGGPVTRGFLALVEPSSALGRSLVATGIGAVDPPEIPGDDGPLVATVDEILRGLAGAAVPGPVEAHPALVEAMDVIAAALPARLRIAEVARRVHLSESRLAHLFAERLGLTFRAHVRWERVRLALGMLSRGDSLSRVAHAAGFSDAAHLSRTFRAMFGSAPSELIRGVVWEGQQVRASAEGALPPTLEA